MTTVVLTRPKPESQRLAGVLRGEGFDSLCLPLMTIVPLTSAERPDLPGPSDIWIFVSANAVRCGLPVLASLLEADNGARVVAVGAKTQETLSQFGVDSRVPDRQDSEGLLMMSEFNSDSLDHVVIVKGEGGRDLLANELCKRGVSVTEFPCYRRCWPEVDLSILKGSTDQWIFQASSGESVSRLTALLVEKAPLAEKERHDLFHCPVVVPSARVAEIASDLGWRTVLRAEDASDHAVISALHQWVGSGGEK